ncbi:hypothetical protein HMPREF1210_02274 [Paenisporosarcina sp. HGH0030]|nr:hypothetical protein HMPREF1210_02274 [Paenisporosarcina sp. HGH0030]
MPIEFHYFSLILFGLILVRIFLKEKKERFKKINAYITVVNIGILLLFNLITYYLSDQYRLFFINQFNTYLLIVIFIIIHITLILDIIKTNKKDEA